MVGANHLNLAKPWMGTQGKPFCPGAVQPREGRAYCSTREWPNSKFPDNNHTESVPRLLSQWPFKGEIILAPGNTISNLAKFSRVDQYTIAEQSVRKMVQVAERALDNYSTLEGLVIVE